MTKSRALFCQGPGAPDPFAVRSCEPSSPQSGEIAVSVVAASVNPIDVRRADGYGARLFRLMKAGHFPLVLGNDFAGLVTEIGPDVFGFAIGDHVFGVKPASAMGTHATDVIVKASHTLHVAAGHGLPSLAALPYSFITMWLALAGAGVTRENARGREVLVHGASGGLGMLALQLLADWGAKTTAIGREDWHQSLLGAGASAVLDAASQPLASIGPRFDATLNFASWDDDASLVACLRSGALGHATTVHPLLGNLDRLGWLRGAIASIAIKRRHRRALPPGCNRYSWTLFRPEAAALAELNRVASRLSLPIGCVTGLVDGTAAFAHVREGRRGRAVILP